MAGAPDVGEIAAANIEATSANIETAQQGGDPGPQLSEERVIAMFCNDMDDAQTRFVLDNFGSEALPIVAEVVSREGLSADIPKTWIRLLDDAILTPGIQDMCIANLEMSPGGTVTVIDLDSGPTA